MLLHDGVILLANAYHILLIRLEFLADEVGLLARLGDSRASILAGVRVACPRATLLLGQAPLQSDIGAL